MNLDGQVALVTGATRGIGKVIVERMAEEGASVVFTGRSKDAGIEHEEYLAGRGLAVSYCQADSLVEDDLRRAVETTVETYGTISTVVNNAMATELTGRQGETSGDSHVTDIANETVEHMLKVGLFGVLWTGKYALPHLQRAGGGSIINISAASSIRAIEGRPAYQATKGAINALTRQMAVDYGPHGVRTNAIIVGFTPTDSPGFTQMLKNEALVAAVRTAIPMPRFGSPTDIANGCVYLASEYGSFVNGVLLPIDGGYTTKLVIPSTRAAAAED